MKVLSSRTLHIHTRSILYEHRLVKFLVHVCKPVICNKTAFKFRKPFWFVKTQHFVSFSCSNMITCKPVNSYLLCWNILKIQQTHFNSWNTFIENHVMLILFSKLGNHLRHISNSSCLYQIHLNIRNAILSTVYMLSRTLQISYKERWFHFK